MRGGTYGRHGVRAPEMATEVQHKPYIKNKIIASSPRGAQFKKELLRKIVPWEKITFSLDNFPYYIDEISKNLLLECVASHVKHSGMRKYRGRFTSSNQRVLLQCGPGTELYRERVVSAIAHDLQVPLLKLSDDVDEESDYGNYYHSETDEDEQVDTVDVPKKLKKGDRVKYVGHNDIPIEEVHNRMLSHGQRGEVYEVDGDHRVAVVFNLCGLTIKDKEKEINTQRFGSQALVTWLDVKYVARDTRSRAHDCFIILDMLYEVLESQQPIIVYVTEDFWRPAMSDDSQYGYGYSSRPSHLKLKNICEQLSSVVMICPQTNNQMPGFIHKLLNNYDDLRYRESEIHDLFTNVVCLNAPKDQDLLNKFITQIKQDNSSMIPQCNLSALRKVLKENNLVCMNLEEANIKDMVLTSSKAEKIVGWATNHYLSSCPDPCVNEGKLHIPHESIKLAILRLKAEETPKAPPKPKEQPKSIKDLATGNERSLVSEVIASKDIGFKFDDVGGLENVKKVMHETFILRIKRPEIFPTGSLLRSCGGMLLFGPPGTGKSLLAKALATELGANFMNITSKCLEDTDIHATTLFSYARKLAPVIIFLDEVDSLFDTELKGFIAAWDDLSSVDRQRIIVIGATNRPFDIEEAVISRMSRRIYVGLPDMENRSKILKVLLRKENLESKFSFERLAEATEGYSGIDLKNLCVVAAYRPVEDFLEQERKTKKKKKNNGGASDGVPALRPLNLNDFIISKIKVKPSVSASSIVELREWNEKYGEGDSF